MTNEKYNIYEHETEDFYVCFCDTDQFDTCPDIALFSGYRRERLSRLRRDSAKRACAAAEYLLIHAMRHLRPELAPPFEYNIGDMGKPYFRNVNDLHFNLSHSGARAACIIANRPCGIDIQQMRLPNMKLAKKYFTEKEAAKCAGDGFTRIWARKEAVIKADGGGLANSLGAFDVTSDTAVLNGKKYSLTDLPAGDGYHMAAAVLAERYFLNIR